jgi:hypothetical protein
MRFLVLPFSILALFVSLSLAAPAPGPTENLEPDPFGISPRAVRGLEDCGNENRKRRFSFSLRPSFSAAEADGLSLSSIVVYARKVSDDVEDNAKFVVVPRSQTKVTKVVNVKKILNDQKKWNNRITGQGKRDVQEEASSE